MYCLNASSEQGPSESCSCGLGWNKNQYQFWMRLRGTILYAVRLSHFWSWRWLIKVTAVACILKINNTITRYAVLYVTCTEYIQLLKLRKIFHDEFIRVLSFFQQLFIWLEIQISKTRLHTELEHMNLLFNFVHMCFFYKTSQ